MEKETLTSRLIDRPIRPFVPRRFYNEVQVTVTVVSTDKTDPDIAAMLFLLRYLWLVFL